MRLINTSTYLLEEFMGQNVPEYAILSHTWEEEEVSFKDMTDPSCRRKKGYAKIEMSCRLAFESGFYYVWVDTCCIDKSSSAELTEAINSMFRWYQRAAICYVYLSDLSAGTSLALESQLSQCRWFTRGWTLQELLAPTHVLFYNKDWKYQFSKADSIYMLAEVTGIDPSVLQGVQPFQSVAVAHKMSWASNRQTTRIEDMAYCLLGIFGVHMPMLYGEEENAFLRLQEEIIRNVPDLSIFAWTLPRDTPTPEGRILCGVLARSPREFSGSGSIVGLSSHARADFLVSNRGIKLQSRIVYQSPLEAHKGIQYICPIYYSNSGPKMGIRVVRFDNESFVREDPYSLVSLEGFPFFNGVLRTQCLLAKPPASILGSTSRLFTRSECLVRTRPEVLQIRLPMDLWIEDVWPWGRWDYEDDVFFTGPLNIESDCGALRIKGGLQIDCMFYAVGWTQSRSGPPQCTIIDRNTFLTEVAEITKSFVDYDRNTFELMEDVFFYKIPLSKSVAIPAEGPDLTSIVSFTINTVTDHSICQNPFWRVEFSRDIVSNTEVPEMHSERWYSW